MSWKGLRGFEVVLRIGHITITPGWMGTVEVVATNIVLNLAFSPMKAMNNAMKKDPQPHSRP